MLIWVLLIGWVMGSIVLGIALGRFLEQCEVNECQRRNALSPTNPHTAPDAISVE